MTTGITRQKKQLRVLIVANNCAWDSWPEKMQELRNWFAPKVSLVFDIEHTRYQNIPFVGYSSNDPRHEKLKGLQGVDRHWYDTHVSSMAYNHDIVLFVMPMGEWPMSNKARGWRTDRDQGPIELQIGADEHEVFFSPRNGKPESTCFFQYARHEIMHALFMIIYNGIPPICPVNISGDDAKVIAEHQRLRCDPTHYWWDKWKFDNALLGLKFPEPNLIEQLAWRARFISILESLARMVMMKKSRINDWAKAIEIEEGYFAPGENPLYPDGTRSWRNCNPGNVKYIGQFMAIGKDRSGFAIFPDYTTGFNHLCKVLTNAASGLSQIYRPEMTLVDFFNIYAPSGDGNNPQRYAENVAARLGVGKLTLIKSLL